jgi:type I restriction enzyme, S subunit
MTIAGENTARTAILRFPACFPDSIVGIIPRPGRADIKFLKYYLDLLYPRIRAITKGATQDNLSIDKLLSFDVVAPCAKLQSEIADRLSAYDDLIENNTGRIATLEEMARALYQEWFVRFRFPGQKHVLFADSPIGPVPEGWEVASFTEIAEVLSGGTPKKSEPGYWGGSIPFYTPRDAPQSAYALTTEANITESGLRRCNSGLYPKDTVFITARGTVGRLVHRRRQKIHPFLAPQAMLPRFQPYPVVGGVNLLNASVH